MKTIFLSSVLLFAALIAFPMQAISADQAGTQVTVDNILWWLPEDTETVIVEKGPFSGADLNAKTSLTADQTLSVLAFVGLPYHQGNWFDTQVRSQTVLLSVEGCRQFRPPAGLGLVTFKGCHVIQFQPTAGESQGGLAKACQSHTKRKFTIGAHEVLVFEEKEEQDDWTFYLTFPQPNVLLCAPDKASLITTLNRMDHRAAKRALPDTLPEWKFVDMNAKFWAVRHYTSVNARFDPTSPFSGPNADRQAVGFAYNSSSDKSHAVTIRYFSSNKNAKQIAENFWNRTDKSLTLQFYPLHPGSVQASVSLVNKEQMQTFEFILMGVLGHAVFL